MTESKGGKIGDRSIVETSFGATGAPAFINRVMPVYPPAARRLGREGRVVLKLLIDRHGKLRSIEVLEGRRVRLSGSRHRSRETIDLCAGYQ